ncbi:MAG: hypothetical protein A3G39_01790 [Deltaproteobacteria bacterium RIFCSPLOWO2_12_FULL_43_16]|nr:MAG: hypothetical protein A2Z89_05510 [Deltaproteobacteria bacterium GWA2_43_19]OGQ11495.1 MAG: hypothetical protein A3D30_09430 [Deltaproteobacteria bacterium RIFCSPHIGHO2_02_FULL_43_33]OGQ60636.1 MAG: hypothetical protein A3G39_01790 [Deltaproteobacteria bacterium RIFCSPLOWO2_12_FULL_43_16]HBR17275.1 hypothetical protein [Deltaproteobacteria bacterium]
MPNIDWKSIVGSVAPTIATALGGPLAGMAVNAISEAVLGKPNASETEVAEGISKANNPEMLLRLKEAEQAFAAKMKELDIDIEKIAAEDRASARQREAAVRDKTPTILAYGYTVGYFAVLFLLWKYPLDPASGIKDLFNILLGILSAAQMAIITYYFGSSSGSAKKSEMIENLLKK